MTGDGHRWSTFDHRSVASELTCGYSLTTNNKLISVEETPIQSHDWLEIVINLEKTVVCWCWVLPLVIFDLVSFLQSKTFQ